MIPLLAALVFAVSPSFTERRIDPPAADTNPISFFLKSAQYRVAPADLSTQAGSVLTRAARFLMSDAGMENNPIRDEVGRKVPPYIYHAVIDDDNKFRYRSSFP